MLNLLCSIDYNETEGRRHLSNLHLTIDSEHRRVWLRTPRRFWFFGYRA